MKDIMKSDMIDLVKECENCKTAKLKNHIQADIVKIINEKRVMSIAKFRNELQLVLADEMRMDLAQWIVKYGSKFAVEFNKRANLKEIKAELLDVLS